MPRRPNRLSIAASQGRTDVFIDIGTALLMTFAAGYILTQAVARLAGMSAYVDFVAALGG